MTPDTSKLVRGLLAMRAAQRAYFAGRHAADRNELLAAMRRAEAAADLLLHAADFAGPARDLIQAARWCRDAQEAFVKAPIKEKASATSAAKAAERRLDKALAGAAAPPPAPTLFGDAEYRPADPPARKPKAGPAAPAEPPPCGWCGKPAHFLCDFSFHPAPASDADTCSAPICGEHRTVVSSGFIHFTDNRGRRQGEPFSVDHCPDHAGVRREGGGA